jgi:hypothetical protein
MLLATQPTLPTLLRRVVGSARAERLLATLELPNLPKAAEGRVHRSELAVALAALLLEDVTTRVPMARAYTADLARRGQRLLFDHGALRTVATHCGDLPAGREAFARFLEPLGYRLNGVYPLDKIGMTGFVFTHADLAESIPQYFVSELHPERFSPAFQAAVARVVGASRDPLPAFAHGLLLELAMEHSLAQADAERLLPELVACFARQHAEPALADYEALAGESDEMAWIATEGQAFNHATDRVDDVAAVAEEQRRLGRPIKSALETSRSGRVIQTAFRAAEVERLFVDADGQLVARRVPGSFHEFITRKPLADGSLDLSFDAGNAQGIFAMTTRSGAGS